MDINNELNEFFSLIKQAKQQKKEEIEAQEKEYRDLVGDLSLESVLSEFSAHLKGEDKPKREVQEVKEERQIQEIDSWLTPQVESSDVKDIVNSIISNNKKPVITENKANDDVIDRALQILEKVTTKEEVQTNTTNPEISRIRRELENLKNIVAAQGGGGEVRLEFLDDVDRTSAKVDGKFLKYQSSTGKFIGADADATGLTGTPDIVVGIITASNGEFSGTLNVDGNISCAGTITYNDVTNVDSLGIGTFRSGVVVNTGTATTALVVNGDARITGILTIGTSSLTLNGTDDSIQVGTGLTIRDTGDAVYSGVITATTFNGNLTGNVTGNVTGNADTATTATTATNAQGLTGTPNIVVGFTTVTTNTDGTSTLLNLHADADGTDNGVAGIKLSGNGGDHASYIYGGHTTSGNTFLSFYTDLWGGTHNPQERARITSSGNFGIGNTNAGYRLDIQAADTTTNLGYAMRLRQNPTADAATLQFTDSGVTAEKGYIACAAGNLNLVASTSMSFATNGSTPDVTIDSSGRFMVGATSSINNECILQTAGDDSIRDWAIKYTGTSGNAETGIRWLDKNNAVNAQISNSLQDDGVGTAAAHLVFKTATGGTLSEQMRLDKDGRLLVGDSTSVGSFGKIQALSTGTVNIIANSSSFSNTDVCSLQAIASGRVGEVGLYKHSGISNPAAFLRLDESDGTLEFLWVDNSGNLRIANSVSFVGTTSGTVVGNQTSDERLKNVAGNVTYGLAEVLQLQPKQYALKSEPDTNKLGFIAQEVQSIIPESVFDTNEELEGHQEGDSTKLGMEYVQLIPVLVNAIKELNAKVENLEAKVAALENN